MTQWVDYQELPDRGGLRKTNERLKFVEKDFKGKTILDLGCWAGQMMLKAKEWGGKPFGVEIDSAAIVVGRGFGLDIMCSDLENPFFWRQIEKFDVVLLLSILGNMKYPEVVLSQSESKTNEVMYVEGHGSYHPVTKEYWVDMFIRCTKFPTIEYLGETPDRSLFRLSNEWLPLEEIVKRAGDRVAIIGKPGVGKTHITKYFDGYNIYSDEDAEKGNFEGRYVVDSHGALLMGEYDTVILVTCDEKTRIERIKNREYDESLNMTQRNAEEILGFITSPHYRKGAYNFYTYKND